MHVSTADSVWAFELAHSAALIAARLGVPKLRFAPGPLPEQAAAKAPRTVAPPSPEHVRAAGEIASSLSDENLRESVQKAVSFGLARTASDRLV